MAKYFVTYALAAKTPC